MNEEGVMSLRPAEGMSMRIYGLASSMGRTWWIWGKKGFGQG